MPKHNNIINNNHFRKDWQRRVKTFFDQPAQKKKRYLLRKAKAAKTAPRPVGLLRPAVRCPSQRYNMKVRLGRGFTPAELQAAGFSAKNARTYGIAVDKRRKNRSDEGFDMNVKRLKEYKRRLVVLTKKNKDAASQDRLDKQLGLLTKKKGVEVMKLALCDDVAAYATLRFARHNKKQVGNRVKKANEEKSKKKK